MSSFRGIDTKAAPQLVQALRSWPTMVDGVIALISEAEMLSDLTVNVTGELDEIGGSGRTMALAVDMALASILGHKLTLAGSQRIVLARLATFRGAADDALQDELALIHGTKTLEETSIYSDRVDGLVTSIKSDTAAGHNPAANFEQLNHLLTVVSGDETGAVAAAATALLMQGVPAAEMPGLSVQGHDVYLERLAYAMENGLSPDRAGLHPLLFPADYMGWHAIDAERQNATAIVDLNDELWHAIEDRSIGSPPTVADLQSHLDDLDIDDARRSDLQLLLDNNVHIATKFEGSQLRGMHDLRMTEVDVAMAEINRLTALLADLTVPTLHEPGSIGRSGGLGAFDSIGAAATMALRSSSAFIGGAYGERFGEFDYDQVPQAVELMAGDSDAASAFFLVLGSEATALVLHNRQQALRLQGDTTPVTSTDFAKNFGTSLGHASAGLGTAFAEEMIETQPRDGLTVGDNVAPEWVFASGSFDSGFLVAAGATSAALHGGSGPGGVTDDELALGVVNPLAVILEAIAAADLGIEFVKELGKGGTLDAFVWADPPIRLGPHDHLSSESESAIMAETRVLLDARRSPWASKLLIDSAGSRLGELELPIANGLSQVLAGQVGTYVKLGDHSPYFDAAENIFAAGAGVDIVAAIQVDILDTFVDGLTNGANGWYEHTGSHGNFAGLIAARWFKVFENNAALIDQAIENSRAWISALTTTVGVVVGVAGVPASGGSSLALAGIGIGASGAGWIAPMVGPDPDSLERFYRDQIFAVNNADALHEGIVLVAAATTGAFNNGDLSFDALDSKTGTTLTLATDAHPGRVWQVDWNDSTWVYEIEDALTAAGATGVLDPPERWSAAKVLTNLGDPLTDQYHRAFASNESPTDG